ncbi:MAG: hypothetical protein FWD63_04005 [Propionibacteriaceae bacterium]|nr:hypothetical protein [Propionibacteriaceae bacterium]
MRDIINPLSLLGITKVLTSEDHKTITQGFIADFFGLKAELDQIHIVEPYSVDCLRRSFNPEFWKSHRMVKFDAAFTVDMPGTTHKLYVRREPKLMEAAKLHVFGAAPDLDEGGPSVWSMNLANEPIFPDGHAHRWLTMEMEGVPDTPTSHLGFFELMKQDDESPVREQWRHFLVTGTIPSTAPEYLKEAVEVLEYSNLSPEETELAKETCAHVWNEADLDD